MCSQSAMLNAVGVTHTQAQHTNAHINTHLDGVLENKVSISLTRVVCTYAGCYPRSSSAQEVW